MRLVPSTWRRRVLVVVGMVLVVFLATTARLFIWPVTNPPTHVNAVVVLGGSPEDARQSKGIDLALRGYAPVVVVSTSEGERCPAAHRSVTIICFHPNPVDTRGEAEFSARLAARNHWGRLIVISERSQTTRARLLFERCTEVNLYFSPVTDPPNHLLGDVVYEWGALLKALLVERSC